MLKEYEIDKIKEEVQSEKIQDIYADLNREKILNLLQDFDDVPEQYKNKVDELKEKIINREFVDLSDENVQPDILLLEDNIPNDISLLEKVRWLYINLGKLFSYDYRVANDPSYGYDKTIDFDNFIGRYQTCIQISEIMCHVLNKIPGIKCNVISRKLTAERGQYGHDHVANEVIIDDNGYELKLLLDLTLDLYLIQADCLTMHFGYEDDGTGTYDIISQSENKKMDINLGFSLDDDDYTNTKIEATKEKLKQVDFNKLNDKEILELKLSLINKLTKKFPGYHEGKRYTELLFNELLHAYYREYNLYYSKNKEVNLKTIYKITLNDYDKWIIYSNKSGFISTNMEKIQEMLNDGWITNSNTLQKGLSIR